MILRVTDVPLLFSSAEVDRYAAMVRRHLPDIAAIGDDAVRMVAMMLLHACSDAWLTDLFDSLPSMMVTEHGALERMRP